MSIWEYDANGYLTGEYFTPINSYQGSGGTYYNPVAVGELGKNNRLLNQLENTFLLQYRINDWLTFRETVSFQYQGSKSNTFLPYNAIGVDWLSTNVNLAQETNGINQGFHTETQLTFGSPFRNKDHVLSGAFTWITDEAWSESMYTAGNKTPSVDIQDPAVDAQINYLSSSSNERRMLSGLSNVNYKYLDKYMLQTILRADAHSSFGANKRWGLFKGLSVAWRFSDESFLESLEFLGESKLRYSWGVSGRQPGDVYARFATYETTGTGSYITNPAIAPTRPQLINLRWETITSNNAGADLSLLDRKSVV